MNTIDLSIFRNYDIRGLYPEELDEQSAFRVGWAFGRYLIADKKYSPPFEVAVGMDMRTSSAALKKELIRGLNDQGIGVVDIGLVSTPAFFYAVAFHKFAGGVMVSASHMPKQYNGLKICSKKAESISKDSGLQIVRDYFLEEQMPAAKERGTVKTLAGISAEYTASDLSYLPIKELKKFKIAADPGNCMGATYLEEFSKLIPCEMKKINWELDGTMPAHEANPLKLETLRQLQDIIKHEGCDLGIATDGDGDRISFIDETGQIIPTDIAAGIAACEILKTEPKAKIVYDLRFSRGVLEKIREAGGELIESPVGYVLIKKLMQQHGAVFGGELSGHMFYYKNNFESPVFVAALLLLAMSRQGKPLSEIWRLYKTYFHSGEINFKIADKPAIMDKLEKFYSGGKVNKLDGIKVDFADWWFNVRPSANDPVLRLTVEADSEEKMKQKVEELANLINEVK